MRYKTSLLLIMSLTMAASCALASKPGLILETDWLESEAGSTGDVLGAKVVDVESNPANDFTTIEIEIPVKNPEDFESIQVIGKESQKPIQQKREAEWLENYEKGVYGLRLHLKKQPGFEFRLRLIDSESEQNMNTKNP